MNEKGEEDESSSSSEPKRGGHAEDDGVSPGSESEREASTDNGAATGKNNGRVGCYTSQLCSKTAMLGLGCDTRACNGFGDATP